MDGSQGMRGRVGSRQICKAWMLRFEKIASHSLSGLFNNIQDLTLIRHIDCWHWRWLSWWCRWGCYWWGWWWWWRGSAVEAVGQALLPLLHNVEDQTWFNLEQLLQWIHGNNCKKKKSGSQSWGLLSLCQFKSPFFMKKYSPGCSGSSKSSPWIKEFFNTNWIVFHLWIKSE